MYISVLKDVFALEANHDVYFSVLGYFYPACVGEGVQD